MPVPVARGHYITVKRGRYRDLFLFSVPVVRRHRMVGVTGLEPAASWSRTSSKRALFLRSYSLTLSKTFAFHFVFPLPKKQFVFWGPLYLRALGSCRNIKKQAIKTCFLVGVTGLEPAASWSRTKRATKLRYTPFFLAYIFYILFLFFASVSAIFLLSSI